MSTKRSEKGIALASVMMVSIILLALSGAFFAAHKTDLMLMGTSVNLERSKNAALSAAEFFQYKLRNDRFYGTEAFEDGKEEKFPPDDLDPMMTVTYESDGDDPSTNRVRGEIHKTGLTFEARILNHLELDAPGELSEYGSTPARSVRVWIHTKQGLIEKDIDFILKRSPFSSVSMLSGNDITVNLTSSEDGHWWLGARQPSGNAVRANGNVTGPEVLSKTGRAVLFEAPEGLEEKIEPPYGVIQGSNLSMQMDGVMTPIDATDERLEEVEENILGVLSPGGSGVEVPKLNADDLTSPVNTFTIPAQEVSFRTRTDGDRRVHELVLDGENVVATYDGVSGNREFVWGTAATFDLENRTMRVTENYELQTTESFTLKGESDLVGPDGELLPGNQPTLILGSEWGAASIEANGISIEGSVGGQGALKAGKADLSIRAKSSLSTTPDFGVALHSEENVILSKPGSSSSDGIPSDWDAFSAALTKKPMNDLDGWMGYDDDVKSEKSSTFSQIVLSGPGTQPGDDPVWLSLTDEFSADGVALDAYNEWTQVEIEPKMKEDTSVPHPMVEQTNPDTGEVELVPEPGWSPPLIVDVPGQDAGPGMNIENYVRMREYLKTKESGKADPTWLDSSNRRNEVIGLIKNQMSSFQTLAGQTSTQKNGFVELEWNPLTEYFKGSNPFLTGYTADMSFRGLIYAGKDFRFDTQQQGIEIEGALVAHGDMDIKNATGARIIYNSDLLEKMFIANEGDTSAKLDRTYWAYY